jgi:RHS repeat-associated protein
MSTSTKNTTPLWHPPKPNSEGIFSNPFGSVLSSVSKGEYRYGWNGAEKDNEISGIGNTLDLGERNYSSRLCKMFSPDPLESKYPWQSTYAYYGNSPISQIDWKGAGDGDDWIKNNKTGEYTWDNNVTSSSNTPKGSTYVGKDDNSIVNDMFEKNQYTDNAQELVAVSTEGFNNPYSAKGYATIHANVFSEMNVLINPMVTTTYNPNGSVNTKTFDGLKMNVWASSYITPSGADLNYVGPTLKVNSADFSQTLVNLSVERTMKINGKDYTYTPSVIRDASKRVDYQLNSTVYFNSSELLKYKNSNMNFRFNFSANLWNGNTPLTIPTVLGSISGQPNTVRMSVNFRTRR